MRNLITGGMSNPDYEVFLEQEKAKKKVAATILKTARVSSQVLVVGGPLPQISSEEFAQMRRCDPSQSELAEIIRNANVLAEYVKVHGEVIF